MHPLLLDSTSVLFQNGCDEIRRASQRRQLLRGRKRTAEPRKHGPSRLQRAPAR